MKSKVTPGLWRAFLKKSHFLGGTHWHVGSEDMTVFIARICETKGVPLGTSEANARAIAAVPEMIEALLAIKAQAKFNGAIPIILVMANVALEKALGKE